MYLELKMKSNRPTGLRKGSQDFVLLMKLIVICAVCSVCSFIYYNFKIQTSRNEVNHELHLIFKMYIWQVDHAMNSAHAVFEYPKR